MLTGSRARAAAGPEHAEPVSKLARIDMGRRRPTLRRPSECDTCGGRSQPAAGTLVETYLRWRAITHPPPPTLRFVPWLRHRPSGGFYPAIVAAIQGADGNIIGVHRTFLAEDGSGKASVEPARMTLGRVAGGAVRLAPAGKELAVTELDRARCDSGHGNSDVGCTLGTRGASTRAPADRARCRRRGRWRQDRVRGRGAGRRSLVPRRSPRANRASTRRELTQITCYDEVRRER